MPPESESRTTLSPDEGLFVDPLLTVPVICAAKRLAEKMKQKSAKPIRFVSCTVILSVGDPGRIRTSDLRFRKPSLYPSELQGHSDILQEFRMAERHRLDRAMSHDKLVLHAEIRKAHLHLYQPTAGRARKGFMQSNWRSGTASGIQSGVGEAWTQRQSPCQQSRMPGSMRARANRGGLSPSGLVRRRHVS